MKDKLDKKQHLLRHGELHGMLDELVADFIKHTKKSLLKHL